MKKLFTLLTLTLSFNSFSQSALPADSLVAWFPFNGNTQDESGKGNNATLQGAELTTDRFGNPNSAFAFDSSYDRIISEKAFFNVGWPGYTISCWINSNSFDNPTGGNNNQTILNTIPHNGFALGFNWGNSTKYSVCANSDPGSGSWDVLFLAKTKTAVTINTWNHLAIVKNNDQYSYYINGVLDTVFTGNKTVSDYSCKLIFGRCDTNVCTENFLGKIDDYGIWNRALTSNEVNQLYTLTTSISSPNYSAKTITVHPNPAADYVTLTIDGNTLQKNTFYTIQNVLGETILKGSISNTSTQINIATLDKGIYFMNFPERNSHTYKIVKQ